MRTNKRIEYIDFMKGVSIFLVVLGHVYQFCIKDTGYIFNFIYKFHMPFFFLLSGYFAKNAILDMRNMKKKTISLILPFLCCGFLFATFNGNWNAFICNDFHAGYWFLLSLWQCWIMFLVIQKLLALCKIKNALVEICALLIPFFLSKLFTNTILSGSSLSFTFAFYRFFVLGYIIGKYQRLEEYLSMEFVTAICIILFLTVFFSHKSLSYVPTTIVQITLCLTFFSLLKYIHSICKSYKFCEYVSGGGRRSLQIYVFHYFIIYKFTCTTLNGMSSGWQLLVASAISVVIIILTLLVASVFERNNILAYLFLGKRKYENSILFTKQESERS